MTKHDEPGRLIVDRCEIERFFDALFLYAPTDGYVSFRGFDQFGRGVPPIVIKAGRINGSPLSLAPLAEQVAQTCADAATPAVFAPPICVFSNPKRARTVDLAAGLVLSVDVDDCDPDAAGEVLEALLGPATVVVASGSDWTDPNTGEVKPKIHAHWRLTEPTFTQEDHARLRQARDMAARLVGADPTGKPVVHPLRWPGSWNCKTNPRMARIIKLKKSAEIDLGDALNRLTDAIEAAGLDKAEMPPGARNLQAPIPLVTSALAAIPNSGIEVHYDDWIRLGYAVHNATGGAPEGFIAWNAWSRKSDKYDATETEAAWKRISAAIKGADAPVKVGAGTIFYLACQAGWRRPSPFGMGGAGTASTGEKSSPNGTARDPVAAAVAEFNERYMVVNEAGKTIVYEPVHDVLLNRRHYGRITFEDLRRLYLNRRVVVGCDNEGKAAIKSIANVWLSHADRRQFVGGVIFDPSGQRVPPNTLNLWQGFAVQPRQGSWARLQDHILQVICDGNGEHYEFLVGWMARLVQKPAEQGEVAVVLRGGEGTGKGTLAKALLHVLGQHGLAISNSKHLTGNFNGHLRDTVLLFADEAFFAGDRAHVGILKALITEPFLTIEAKYQNAVQMPNFVHLMMASNEDWVVPAALDARRFFVLEVSAARANDHSYFAAIRDEMCSGGYEGMLNDLLSHDLTNYNPRRVPVTAGLQIQRKRSMPTAEDWWAETLMRGYVFKSQLGLEDYFGRWHELMATEVLFDAYATYAKARGERRPMRREAFGKFMVRMGAKSSRRSDVVSGEHVTNVATTFGTTRQAELIHDDRSYCYSLGSLSTARDDFQKATGLQMEWPEEDEDEA